MCLFSIQQFEVPLVFLLKVQFVIHSDDSFACKNFRNYWTDFQLLPQCLGEACQVSLSVVKCGDHQHQCAEHVNSMQGCSKEGGIKGATSSLDNKLNATINLNEASCKFDHSLSKDGPGSKSAIMCSMRAKEIVARIWISQTKIAVMTLLW